MRISDWSSDVCSSDLGQRLEQAAVGERLNQRLPEIEGDTHQRRSEDETRQAAAELRVGHEMPARAQRAIEHVDVDRRGERGRERGADREIGRASGRERVCQYV